MFETDRVEGESLGNDKVMPEMWDIPATDYNAVAGTEE